VRTDMGMRALQNLLDHRNGVRARDLVN